MVSASTEKSINEMNKATVRDELQRSVSLSMTEYIEDQPEHRTTDGYKIHLELLSKRIKSDGRQTVYTACLIGQCLYELKQIYHGKRNF